MADAWTQKLDIYLDGELPAGEMSALDAHVRACPDCAASVLGRLQLKRATQAAGQRYSPAVELRQRVQKLTRVRGPRQRWAWQMVAVVAAFLIVFGMALVQIKQTSHTREIYSEIADLHVTTLASASPLDVVSTDRHTVKPWFEGKIPFTFNLPELQTSEFTLVGGRVTYVQQVSGAHLLYRIRKHQISVFIFPEGSALPADSGLHRRATFEMQSWTQDNLRYFVIGDAPTEDIGKLVDLLKRAEHA